MRWKPTRAGIFNVWEYDDQIFEFGDGRLALRGRNGSGKSNALALLFPFVFDGVMSAARMDPMGGARSMKSLLLGRDDDDRTGRFRHDSGTGYVWMELTNGDEHVTIGIGAAATQHRDADAWFFLTSARVGFDFELAEGDVPLGRRRLEERLPPGATFTTAEDYRIAVDRRLLGLGQARYRTLVDLLLTLRRPHLAGKLDTDHLSSTLSAGLGELDPALVDDVAHSFDDLDAMQHELEGIAESLSAVERFLPAYREHLVSVARTRAWSVLAAHTESRRVESDRTSADADRQSAGERSAELRADVAHAEHNVSLLDTEIDAIKASPAYRDATALAEVEKAAAKAASQLEVAKLAARKSAGDAAAAAQDTAAAQAETVTRTQKAQQSVQEWSASAHAAGIDAPIGPDGFDDAYAIRVVRERGEDVRRIRQLAEAARDAVRKAEDAETDRSRLQTLTEAANTQSEDAAAGVAYARQELTARRGAWNDEFAELIAHLGSLGVEADATTVTEAWAHRPDVDDHDDVEDLLSRAGVDIDAFTDADRCVGVVDTAIIRAVDAARSSADEQTRVVDELTIERQCVADEPNPGPPPNPTRPDSPHLERAGSPLFVCVDFAAHVDADARAGLEAALGGAGLLDARITPNGSIDESLDATLVATFAQPSTSQTLADVLIPVPVGDLDTDRILSVLRAVPLADGVVELHPDGRWRLGPLSGRYAQSEPRYVGHAAREQRRAQRLSVLDDQLVAAHAELQARERHHDALVDRRAALAAVRAKQPATDALVRSVAELRKRLVVAEERAAAFDTARTVSEALFRAAEAATAEVHRAAGAVRLPVELAALHDVSDALRTCNEARTNVATHQELLAVAEAAHRTASSASDRADARARDDLEATHQAAFDADEERVRYEQLRANVGVDAQQAIERLRAATDDRDEVAVRVKRLLVDLTVLDTTLATLDERLRNLLDQQRHAAAEVRKAEQRFSVVCSAEIAEVLAVAGVEPGAEARRAARRVIDGTDAAADDATNRMERAHREILLDGLRAGHDPSMPKVDDVDVVRVGTADGELPIASLAIRLRAEHERTSQLLSRQEREIFETHLLTRIGDALRRLLLDADAFEHEINAEMAKVPTESGMVVELRWEITSDESGLRAAVETLRTAPEMLGPERREALREFFMQRIADLRSSDPGRSFAETLTVALDYRSWHQFALFARFSDGKRQRVTRTFFRGLSGGEAATLLHLPLFAAAASQYSSGAIAGPRLIALDEAFVGIDDPMRARLMGLLTQLELDVILTSHEFWGFYDTVPSLVLYDLTRKPPTPGVFAQRFSWSADRAHVGDGG